MVDLRIDPVLGYDPANMNNGIGRMPPVTKARFDQVLEYVLRRLPRRPDRVEIIPNKAMLTKTAAMQEFLPPLVRITYIDEFKNEVYENYDPAAIVYMTSAFWASLCNTFFDGQGASLYVEAPPDNGK